MSTAEAVALAWDIGGHVMVVLGIMSVLLIGLAVLGEINR